jgi:hypothetical protein
MMAAIQAGRAQRQAADAVEQLRLTNENADLRAANRSIDERLAAAARRLAAVVEA